MSNGKSNLPNGGFTLTHGSNYMMDGFQFDTEYGGGVYEKARLPEAKGLSALPEGMIPTDSVGHSGLPVGLETEHDLNIEEISKEAGQEITLVDHSWLASEPKPDLSGERSLEDLYQQFAEGRFENPQVNQLKTLQEAWGGDSTTGLDIVPNENRINRPYQNSYSEDQSKLPGDRYRQNQESMQRKLAYGHPLKEVLEGVDSSDLQLKLASEYGLHGRVYIKEEYFPGLFNGRWDEVINKRCATSMYIIPNGDDCIYDRFLGMEVVKDIPWKRVASALLPRLETYGVKIAGGSPKERVQRAFIDLIEGRVSLASSSATWFQIQEDHSDLVSLDQARKVLNASEQSFDYIPSQEEVHETKEGKRLARISSQLVEQGFLESEVVDSVLSTSKTAKEKMDRLYVLASRPVSSSEYEGHGKERHLHTTSKKAIEGDFETREEISLKQRFVKAKQEIKELVSRGLITVSEANRIIAKHKTPEGKVAAVIEHLANVHEVSEFKGTRYEAHIAKRASLPTKSAHEVQSDKISVWIQQKMSEGMAGEELDLLLSTRFAKNILDAHQERIASLRNQHEGLSGHAYVDASAYLTEGTDGCEKGSLMHRANQIPAVLKTARCGGCVFNSQGRCLKYAKTIVASAEEIVEDAHGYQQEMIRLANASDAERTASLFVNDYDQDEYNLVTDGVVEIEGTAPSHESLGDVLFGGFEV